MQIREILTYLFQDVVKQMGAQVVRNLVAEMAIEDSKEAKLIVIDFFKLGNHVILHLVECFPFQQVETVCDLLRHLALALP